LQKRESGGAMTTEKLKSVLQQYYRMLADDSPLPITAKRLDDEQSRKRAGNIGPVRGMSHIMWMCVEAQKFVDEGRIEKAMRWLGFIQGVLWMSQARTLEQLKDDSRPRSAEDLQDELFRDTISKIQETYTLSGAQATALADWADEQKRKGGTSGWGPKFDAAMAVAEEVASRKFAGVKSDG
jgi:hypothetical protein